MFDRGFLNGNQVVPLKQAKLLCIVSTVRELSEGVHVDKRERGCLAKRSEDSQPRMGG